MIGNIASYTGRIAKVSGPAACGKTEALIQRCITLLQEGAEPESILVATPTANAAVCFRHRLIQTAAQYDAQAAADSNIAGEIASDDAAADQKTDQKLRLEDLALRVVVERALDRCIFILNQPAAQEQTGRVARILTKSEYDFLLEDLKTLGQKNQRLKNMIDFFFAQWSKFEDEDDWLIRGEESTVLGRMRDIMRLQGTMLRDEAPYLCAQLLNSPEGAAFTQQFDYVFCDDYQDLSYAEQVCMCRSARRQLIVCGNADHATYANTNYPCPKAFDQFELARRGVEVFELTQSFGAPIAALISAALDHPVEDEDGAQATKAADAGGDPQAATTTDTSQAQAADAANAAQAQTLFLLWENPDDEMNSFASIARAWLARGEGARLSDICIAVPTKRWGNLVRKTLKEQGIPASDAGLNQGLGGDPRVPGYHESMTAYAKLLLAADKTDMLAWRLWGGFDHALTNSDVWRCVYDTALDTGLSLYETFKQLANGTLQATRTATRLQTLSQIWETGQELIAQCAQLKGRELAQATGVAKSFRLAQAAAIQPDDDAISMRDKVRAQLLGPSFVPDDNRVRIALLESTEGMQCPCLVLPGLVNGMLPHRDAFDPIKSDAEHKRAVDIDRKRFAACLPRGTRCVIASAFSQADVELAERSKMQVQRIVSQKGERTALLKPSFFLQGKAQELSQGITSQPSFVQGDEQVLRDFIAGV